MSWLYLVLLDLNTDVMMNRIISIIDTTQVSNTKPITKLLRNS